MLRQTKKLVRFYSTPTFHNNFKCKNSKKNIIKNPEISNENFEKKNDKYRTYYSYKNMYNCLPIKSYLKQ